MKRQVTARVLISGKVHQRERPGGPLVTRREGETITLSVAMFESLRGRGYLEAAASAARKLSTDTDSSEAPRPRLAPRRNR